MADSAFRMVKCAVPGIHAVEAQSHHSFARHTHDQFGIGLIHHGAQKSRSGRGMVEAGAGDTIMVNPGEVHDGAPIGDAGRAWRMLYFDPSVIADIAEDIGGGDGDGFEFDRPALNDPRIARRFTRLFAAITVKGTPAIAHEQSLFALLAGLMRGRADRSGKRPCPVAIADARRLIDDDPAAPLTLADLAQACGLDRFQLMRGFTRATGLTPHAYIVQQRIDLARRLIACGTPLAQAAAEGGFADQSHMTRIFVRKYGVSPGVYANAVN